MKLRAGLILGTLADQSRTVECTVVTCGRYRSVAIGGAGECFEGCDNYAHATLTQAYKYQL